MTPVGWFISAALVVIGGIAYAAVLLNVPLLAVAAGVIGALAGVFLLVTHRPRAPMPTASAPAATDSAESAPPADESESRD